MAQVTRSFSYLNLVCGEEHCTHCVSVKNPNDLIDTDILLLNRLSEPDFTPGQSEAIRIWTMLDHQDYACPTHGQKHLSFSFEETIHAEGGPIEIDLSDSDDHDSSGEGPWWIIEI